MSDEEALIERAIQREDEEEPPMTPRPPPPAPCPEMSSRERSPLPFVSYLCDKRNMPEHWCCKLFTTGLAVLTFLMLSVLVVWIIYVHHRDYVDPTLPPPTPKSGPINGCGPLCPGYHGNHDKDNATTHKNTIDGYQGVNTNNADNAFDKPRKLLSYRYKRQAQNQEPAANSNLNLNPNADSNNSNSTTNNDINTNNNNKPNNNSISAYAVTAQTVEDSKHSGKTNNETLENENDSEKRKPGDIGNESNNNSTDYNLQDFVRDLGKISEHLLNMSETHKIIHEEQDLRHYAGPNGTVIVCFIDGNGEIKSNLTDTNGTVLEYNPWENEPFPLCLFGNGTKGSGRPPCVGEHCGDDVDNDNGNLSFVALYPFFVPTVLVVVIIIAVLACVKILASARPKQCQWDLTWICAKGPCQEFQCNTGASFYERKHRNGKRHVSESEPSVALSRNNTNNLSSDNEEEVKLSLEDDKNK